MRCNLYISPASSAPAIRSIFFLFTIFLSGIFFHPAAYASDHAMESKPAEHDVHGNIPENGKNDFFHFLWGVPAEDTILLGMWAYHFVDNDDSYQTSNKLLGLSYKGYYAGTFKNSHDNRTWSVGFQRDIYRTEVHFLSISAGYRAGLMYGYETMQIYETKLFPLFQVYTNLSFKRAGVQLSWAGSVLTAGFIVKF